MITKDLENVIEKYKITETSNIIYGTNIPMPNAVIPTPWKTYIRFDQTETYFFLFNDKGISIYQTKGESYAFLPWEEIEDLKISHFLIIGKLQIKTKDATYKFQLNRFVIGCPWIKNNTRYLEDNKYFYHK